MRSADAEPVVAWERRPPDARRMPPQLLVAAVVVATAIVIWWIGSVREPIDEDDDGGTPVAATAPVSDLPATIALAEVERIGASAVVHVTVVNDDLDADVAIGNDLRVVRDQGEVSSEVVGVVCLAVDDEPDKALVGATEVSGTVGDASVCGAGGFRVPADGRASVVVTIAELPAGTYRLLVGAGSSAPFTVG
ncbi:MAG: hypothetical protein R2713_19420 [Ilumatobacteraceae bacterium]